MNGHLRRCRFGIPPHVRLSTLRREAAFVRHARHVRPSTLRAQGLPPPCIWRIPEQAPRGFVPRLQRNINLQAPTSEYSDKFLASG